MDGELISSEELAQILHDADVRIFDCTTRLDYQPPGSDIPYIPVPGLDTFVDAHIPGADFLDIQREFSDQHTKLRFMMAETAELEGAFRGHGISNDSRVVLYSLGSPMWATRFWWMLESLGCKRASVLDGGLEKWSGDGRPIERGPPGAFQWVALKLASGFERQADILLRQRRLSGVGAAQIVELVDPHPFLERFLRREAVEQHREPPGHARRGPHAT